MYKFFEGIACNLEELVELTKYNESIMGKRMFALIVAVFCWMAGMAQNRAEMLRDMLYNSKNYCMVVAHRGDWRYAPENSLQAFQNCIDMGVDMVELDLKMTKDSVLVLMHDWTLDRTTTAKGYPADYTFEELRSNHKLKNSHSGPTRQDIPTLEEALNLCKGKILINIDKGYDYFKEVCELLEKTGTLGQVVIKSGNMLEKVRMDNPGVLEKVIYMPVVNLNGENAERMIDEFATIHPVAIECCFNEFTTEVARLLEKIKGYGIKIWVNSLWASLNAGHDDEMAVEENCPDESWGWILEQGALMIQTDRPEKLIEYLGKKGKRK